MNTAIAGIHLIGGWLPLAVNTVAVVSAFVMLGGLMVRRGAGGAALAGIAAASGAVVGLVVCWLLSDQLDLFEVSLTPTSRAWVAGAFAAIGMAAVAAAGSAQRTRGAAAHRALAIARRPLAVVVAITALLAGSLGVNADFGQYTTIGSLSDASIAPHLPRQVLATQSSRANTAGASTTGAGTTGAGTTGAGTDRSGSAASDSAPSNTAEGMPPHGLVGAVTIPATDSHFAARGAYVYLPPAALGSHPVALPVLIMMSGQPGSPSNVFQSGQLAPIFDAFAASHGGLAPIVVAPDQLGAPDRNPMCVNGALGASATYLTVDVPNWIRTHLDVRASPTAWAIGGFSQGGTCAIQLGAAHPELFASIIDVSGQVAPKNGELTQTVALGFHGDSLAYRAALPASILVAHSRYRDTVAVFGVGQLDSRYGPAARSMTAAAIGAGIHATEVISPGTGHDWHTVQWVFAHALAPIYRQLGLAGQAAP